MPSFHAHAFKASFYAHKLLGFDLHLFLESKSFPVSSNNRGNYFSKIQN
jgi:hypothetical protein